MKPKKREIEQMIDEIDQLVPKNTRPGGHSINVHNDTLRRAGELLREMIGPKPDAKALTLDQQHEEAELAIRKTERLMRSMVGRRKALLLQHEDRAAKEAEEAILRLAVQYHEENLALERIERRMMKKARVPKGQTAGEPWRTS